jgi:hypothetical protein
VNAVDFFAPLASRVRLYAVISTCLLAVLAAAAVEADLRSPNPAARRLALLRLAEKGPAALEQLTKSVGDRDPLVRRAAVLGLSSLGHAAIPALQAALDNDDILVRRNAALALANGGLQAVPVLSKALADPEPIVRQASLHALAMISPRNAETFKIIRTAIDDPVPEVQAVAITASERFLDIVVEMPLPLEQWKFRLDLERTGDDERWFAADLDDSQWDDISIGKAWGHFGYEGYIGVGWYRRTISVPDSPEATGAVLQFEGVDECAWIWVNGQYVGKHDIGPAGWDKPFQVDVGDALRWGEDNQITVKAMNTTAAGGIWMPITLRATRLAP